MALITKDGDRAKNAVDAPKIEFPCDGYMIKVVSLDADGAHDSIVECMKKHAPEVDPTAANINRSSKGRFMSYTFRIIAESEAQLSSLHKELMAIEPVKMVM